MKKSLRHYIAIPLRRGPRNESGRVDVEYITAGSLCSQEATMIVNILYCNLLNGCSLIFSQHLLLVASPEINIPIYACPLNIFFLCV